MPRVDAGMLPPFHLPLRFFATAPLFGILCGFWLLYSGGGIWITRWHPALLGATHLLVLGFLLTAMVGALAQVVPVLACRPLAGAVAGLPVIHILLSAGTVLLALGLGASRPLLLPWATGLLLVAMGLFVAMLARTLFRPPAGETAVSVVRVSAVSLCVTVLLGGWLALATRWPGLLATSRGLTNLHALWGLVGAAGLLILAVGSQVIPMFHVTPSLPRGTLPAFAWVATAGLLLIVANLLTGAGSLLVGGHILLIALAALFGVFVLRLLSRRKRKVPDATVNAWQWASGALILGAVGMILGEVLPAGLLPDGFILAMQILLVLGGPLLIVVGMLLKIVPFLAWMHLQNRAGFRMEALPLVPHMQQLVSGQHARWQVRLHVITTLALVLCPLYRGFHILAAWLLVLDMLLLLLIILKAGHLSWQARRRIDHILSAEEQATAAG